VYERRETSQLENGEVALIGFPWDAGSSFLRGPAQAPARIRTVLASGASNSCSELGSDTAGYVRDVGDLERLCDVEDGLAAWQMIESRTRAVLERGAKVLALGGDHAVTFGIVRAVAAVHGPLDIVHIDAHPDLHPEFDGKPWSHASPFARIAEAGLFSRLVQIGIRTLDSVQRAQVDRYGVEVIEMRNFSLPRVLDLVFERPLYLSIDLDGLDPAFAPGVSHHEPGGLTTREVITLIQELRGTLVAADVVELNPQRDPVGVTAMLAAKFVKELAARMGQ